MSEDCGIRDWEQPCVCGHLKKEHDFEPYEMIKGIDGEDSFCWGCQRQNFLKRIHKFIVDNLALVEQVARARKLV